MIAGNQNIWFSIHNTSTVPCAALPWWRHQMEIFSALMALCAENSSGPGEFPTQRPVTRNFDVFLICARINNWVYNRGSGDLRRHRVHYYVIVMRNLIVLVETYSTREQFTQSKVSLLCCVFLWVNTLRPIQNAAIFSNDVFKSFS